VRRVPVPGDVFDPSRLDTADMSVEAPDGALRAYLARPRGGAGVRPGVIVIHEAFGLNDHIHDVARRFAAVGFDALAPELYTRIGPPDAADPPAMMAKMVALDDAQVVRDLEACAAHLSGLDRASGRVGCVGFCAGGRYTLLLACSSDRVDAAVDCWGGNLHRATPNDETLPTRPVPVVDLLGRLSCPVLLVGGAEDGNPSPDLLKEVHSRLVALGKDASLHIYEGAGHAFFADYRPSYREQAAFALWPEMVGFLQGHLM
jgi:carboxymethylenebutenolidase